MRTAWQPRIAALATRSCCTTTIRGQERGWSHLPVAISVLEVVPHRRRPQRGAHVLRLGSC